MTKEEVIKEMIEWREQMKNHGVPNWSAKLNALNMAIISLSADIPHINNSVEDSDLVFRGQTYGKSANFADNSVTKSSNEVINPNNDVIEHSTTNEEKIADCDLISRAEVMERLQDFCNWCQDSRLEGAGFVLDCLIPNTPSVSAERVVRCKDCEYKVHCHQTVAHTKIGDGFTEYWSEPIEWCSRAKMKGAE